MKQKKKSKLKSDSRDLGIYHIIYRYEGFDEAAQALFKLIQRAQKAQPGKKRRLFLDIEGHRNKHGVFDADMLELQNHFLRYYLSQFLVEIYCPLYHAINPNPQINKIPPRLIIK